MQFIIVEEDGRPTVRSVKTGLNDTEMVEILELHILEVIMRILAYLKSNERI